MKWNKWVLACYVVGQFGWSLASFGVGNLLNYFYMPPESGKTPIFPNFISEHYILGIFTWVGLIAFSGRFFDGFWDTYIAGHSDRAQFKIGKRKFYMILGILPFVVSSFLIFYPISSSQSTNTIWLLCNTTIFYLSMTLYVVPHAALLSELVQGDKDRLLLSTFISIAWAFGAVVGNMAYAMKDYFDQYYSSVHSFQLVLAIFSGISFLAMLMPIIGIHESKHCLQKVHHTPVGFISSIRKAWGSAKFRNFVISDLMYWIAVSVIAMGMVHYVKVLLQMETKYVSYVFLGIYVLSFILYIPTNIIAARLGKIKTQRISFAMTIVVYLMISLLGLVDFIPPLIQISLIGIVVSFPLATFGVIPNAIVGDIIDEYAATTGEYHAALFYAIRSFMMKTGISLANLIFPSIILLGHSTDNDIGVRLSAVFSACCLLIGLLFFKRIKNE